MVMGNVAKKCSFKMNKKGFSISWIVLLEVLAAFFFLSFFFSFGLKGCEAIRQTSTGQTDINQLEILAKYVENLRVEDGESKSPTSFSADYVITTFKKCEDNEKPGIECYPRPRICLKSIKDKNAEPICREFGNSVNEEIDFETAEVSPRNGLILEKEITEYGLTTREVVIHVTAVS